MISQKHKRKIIAVSQHRTYKKKTSRSRRPCKRCGRLFPRQHNRQVYCKKCQPEAQREAHNRAERAYHKRWKSTINRRRLLKPGTMNLPNRIGENWKKEEQYIQDELQRIRKPYRKMYSRDILGF